MQYSLCGKMITVPEVLNAGETVKGFTGTCAIFQMERKTKHVHHFESDQEQLSIQIAPAVQPCSHLLFITSVSVFQTRKSLQFAHLAVAQ